MQPIYHRGCANMHSLLSKYLTQGGWGVPQNITTLYKAANISCQVGKCANVHPPGTRFDTKPSHCCFDTYALCALVEFKFIIWRREELVDWRTRRGTSENLFDLRGESLLPWELCKSLEVGERGVTGNARKVKREPSLSGKLNWRTWRSPHIEYRI